MEQTQGRRSDAEGNAEILSTQPAIASSKLQATSRGPAAALKIKTGQRAKPRQRSSTTTIEVSKVTIRVREIEKEDSKEAWKEVWKEFWKEAWKVASDGSGSEENWWSLAGSNR